MAAVLKAAPEWSGDGGRNASPWALRELSDRLELRRDDATTTLVGAEASQLTVRARWLVFHEVQHGETKNRYRGLSRASAKTLREALRRFTVRARVLSELDHIIKWNVKVEQKLDRALADSRWIPEETIASLARCRPKVDVSWWFSFKDGVELAAALTPDEHAAVEAFGQDLRVRITDINEQIVRNELVNQREFFDRIETSPLTDEQARAVICLDNRVNVVASAGSGKTSVMVARAAYAIHRKFVRPERVLLLAFNKAAAEELQERVTKRLAALEIPSTGLRASTFHSFGLGVIGDAVGRKPRLASWLDGGQDVGMIMRIVDELRDESLEFRFKWDIFRLLYARAGSEPDEGEPDSWDKKERRTGFQTYSGEVVKSQGSE